jgi:sec-independent protein translocase protein TatA
MAFGDPLQWIIIGVIVVVIFLWGPQKIPELARGIGRAKGEFEKASKEFDAASKQVTSGVMTMGTPAATTTTPQAAPAFAEKSGDQVLVETARALGIATEGKSREQISQEIITKTKSSP